MPSKIFKCTCEHDAQDSLHGKGNRVFNSGGKNKETTYSCTVCSKNVEYKGALVTIKKK